MDTPAPPDDAPAAEPVPDDESTLVALNARELLRTLAGEAMPAGLLRPAIAAQAEEEPELPPRAHEPQWRDLLAEMAREPYRFDFFQAVRLLEIAYGGRYRLGASHLLRDDSIRFSQSPTLAFAPSTLSDFEPAAPGRPARLVQRFFGLFGPNGAMPLHVTEYARDRARRKPADRSMVRFLDMFHHRMLSLLYRAWAEAQPTVSLDRPGEDHFSRWIASVAGYGQVHLRRRDHLPDGARLAAAGLLGRQVRSAEGLQRLLRDYFEVPVHVRDWQPHWMRLPENARTRLGRADGASRLGEDAVIGARVWDCQSAFLVEIGPLTFAQYRRFLPIGQSLARLRDWILSYVGHDLACEVRLVLARSQVPQMSLSKGGHASLLGWTAWCGLRREATDAGDLRLRAT